MKLALTPEQCAIVAPQMRVGFALLRRVTREQYDAAKNNIETSGQIVIELGAVKESALPALREAIAKAQRPKPKKRHVKPK